MDAYGPARQGKADAPGGVGPYGKSQTYLNTAAAMNSAAALIAAGLGNPPAQAGLGQPAMSAAPAGDVITTLWVGSLPVGTQEAELARVFGAFGTVVACVVHSKPSPQGSLSGFVRFSMRQEGELAMQYCNAGSCQINNMPVVAKWAKGNSRVGMGVGGVASARPASVMPGMQLASAAPALGTQLQLPSLPPQQPLLPVPRLEPKLQTLSVFGLPAGMTNDQLKAGFEWTGFPCIAQIDGTNNVGFVKFASPELAETVMASTGGSPIGIQGAAVMLIWPQSDMAGDVPA